MKNLVLIIGFAALIVGLVSYAFWPKVDEETKNPKKWVEVDPDRDPGSDESDREHEQEGPTERNVPGNIQDEEATDTITRWTLGVTRRYSVSFQRNVAVGPPSNPTAKQVHAVSGNWSFTITDGPNASGHYRARARLEVSDLSMTDLAVELNETVLMSLREPYFFELRPNGTLADLLFPSTIHARARDVLATITAVAQQSESEDGKQAWRADELDQYGTYTAVYRQRTEDNDAGETRILQRMKAGYTQLRTSLPPEMVPTAHHKTRFIMAQHGWYGQAEMTETQGIAATDKIPEVHSTLEVTLSYIANSRDDAAIGSFEREKLQLVSFFAQSVEDENTPPDDRVVLGDLTLPQILESLRLLGELRTDDAARDAWIPKLSALFRLYPDQTAAAVGAIKNGMHPWTATAVLSGLSGAENEESHGALVSMLQWAATDGKNLLTPVLTALGHCRLGSSEAVHTLTALSKSEVAGSPHLPLIGGALAMQAAALEGPDGAGSAQAWSAVEQLWTGTQHVETKAALVGQVGKSQHPKALSMLNEAAQHNNSLVRASAATVLGDWTGDGIDKTLVLLIQNDTSSDVRRAAILSSLGRNSDLFLDAYETILTSGGQGSDVMAVLQALEQTPTMIAAFKEQLTQLKTTTTNPEIAALADKLLDLR
ncbi:MAG: HEAT repeat domain-containing protein [Myxococcales bacterium]|nr:HEAT repeat domain-containing protein [Myxococcales bacterium]